MVAVDRSRVAVQRRTDRRVAPVAVGRVIGRELQVYRRLWHSTLFSYFIGPSLFLGAMGVGLGGLVQAASNGVDGLSYLEFVAPGLLVATTMQTASADSLWPVLGGMKWLRTFHGMAATPLRASEIYTGELLWIGIISVLSGTAFLLVAAVLGALASVGAVLALPIAILTALAFAAPIMAFSANQESDARFPLIIRFLVQPLFLFSGTFFPISQLPALLVPLAWISPLWHGIELARAATTGNWAALSPAAALGHLAYLVAFVAGGWWLGTASFSRKLAT